MIISVPWVNRNKKSKSKKQTTDLSIPTTICGSQTMRFQRIGKEYGFTETGKPQKLHRYTDCKPETLR